MAPSLLGVLSLEKQGVPAQPAPVLLLVLLVLQLLKPGATQWEMRGTGPQAPRADLDLPVLISGTLQVTHMCFPPASSGHTASSQNTFTEGLRGSILNREVDGGRWHRDIRNRSLFAWTNMKHVRMPTTPFNKLVTGTGTSVGKTKVTKTAPVYPQCSKGDKSERTL